MATTLPPINKKSNNSLQEHSNKIQSTEQFISVKPHSERSLYSKTWELRKQLPVLRKHEIAKFRNTYSHNLCLELLTKGYNMSFCELMNLIQKQKERREAAGPETYLWIQPTLESQPEKLDRLELHMIKAEYASRLGNIEDEYIARFELAQSFKNNPDDQWLVDHFFNTCLDVAKKDGRETKLLAEGYCNVALCFQLNRNHKEAIKLFEAYHRLAEDNKDWKMANGTSFYIDSCEKLYHIYTIVGLELGRSSETEDSNASLVMLKQALIMAQNSQDRKLEGEASYALGMAYQKTNKLDIAFSHLMNFYHSCQGDSDNEGTGRACEAIAKIYARQGNKEKSVEFLKRFVELTEKTGLEKEYCLACHNLGNVCNSVGNYDEATEYFSKAYNISRALGDPESTNINRVQYGIAMAHRLLGKVSNHIAIADTTCMSRLLDWKNIRTDDFDKQIPDTAPEAAYHVLLALPSAKNVEASVEDQEESTEEDRSSFIKEEGEGQQIAIVTE